MQRILDVEIKIMYEKCLKSWRPKKGMGQIKYSFLIDMPVHADGNPDQTIAISSEVKINYRCRSFLLPLYQIKFPPSVTTLPSQRISRHDLFGRNTR